MKKILLLLPGLLLLFQASSFASLISTAPSPYGDAWHTTPEWQRLGDSSALDDGVTWSTDGITFGKESVTIGDTITFKFHIWNAGYGNHDYDQLKAWADFDHDGHFEENSTEVLIYEQQWKTPVDDTDSKPDGNNSMNDDGGATQDQLDKWNAAFASDTPYYVSRLITEDMAAGFWIRARVHCWHTTYPNIVATGKLTQGEVEDYFITVNPVPEPTTMVLFGMGMLGLAGLGRKKQ